MNYVHKFHNQSHQMTLFYFRTDQNRCSLGLCQNPTGELTALSQTPSWFEGGNSQQEGLEGKERKERGVAEGRG